MLEFSEKPLCQWAEEICGCLISPSYLKLSLLLGPLNAFLPLGKRINGDIPAFLRQALCCLFEPAGHLTFKGITVPHSVQVLGN